MPNYDYLKSVGAGKKKTSDSAKTKETLVQENWRAYERARDSGHLKYVEEAKLFDEYYRGEQWEEEVVQRLESEGRPHQTINMVLSTVNAMLGQQIRSREEIFAKPMGKGATEGTAEALSALFHQIAANNKSKWNETQVFADGLIEDRGYFDIRIDFSDNIHGEVREIVLSPRDVLLDPSATEYDPSTWNEVIVTRWMTPDEIGVLYGEEYAEKLRLTNARDSLGYDSIELDVQSFGKDVFPGVFVPDTDEEARRVRRVRVVERQYRKLTRRRYFVDAINGDTRPVPDAWDDARVADFAVRFQLEVMEKPERRIRWTTTGDNCLLYDNWSLYNRFTVVPFFPYFRRGRPIGVVRNLVSPQDTLNKVISQELHVVNTTANSGWIFESGSLVNMDATELEAAGAKTGLILEIARGTENVPVKIQPNQIPSGLAQISAKAENHLRTISGLPDGFMGTSKREVSGVAVAEQRQGGINQMEVVLDNLDKTRHYRAELILDLVQQFYTEERVVRIVGFDDDGNEQATEVRLNSTGPAGEIVNDLTIGEYEISIVSTPQADSTEDSIFAQAMQMREAGVMIPDFVVIENSRLRNKREVSNYVKRLQNMAEPTPEEIQKAMMLEQLNLQLLEGQVREIMSKVAINEAKAQLAAAQAQAAGMQPQLDQQRFGAELRVELEKLQAELEKYRSEAATRLKISSDKNATARFVTQVQSLTKRIESANVLQANLEKSLAQGVAQVETATISAQAAKDRSRSPKE